MEQGRRRRKEGTTYENQMEIARFPLIHRLQPIFRDIIFDLFPLHERRQNRLIDRIIY